MSIFYTQALNKTYSSYLGFKYNHTAHTGAKKHSHLSWEPKNGKCVRAAWEMDSCMMLVRIACGYCLDLFLASVYQLPAVVEEAET